MRRFLVVAVGLLLAFLAGCCFLTTALLLEGIAAPAATVNGLFDVAALMLASLQAGDAGHLLAAGMTAIWAALLTVCLAPVTLVALLAEASKCRSLVWSAGASGAATAAVPTLLRVLERAPERSGGPDESRATLILFLTGIAAGLVYWAVAGRGAGAGRIRPLGSCVSE